MTKTTAQVRERPILFSGPMVRAILEERKTQTRRIVKPQRHPFGHVLTSGEVAAEFIGGTCSVRCPYGQPGDRLWVRETWRTWAVPIACEDGTVEDPSIGIEYAADKHLTFHDFSKPGTLDLDTLHRYGRQYEIDMEGPGTPRTRSPIHMPRWASRITLRITDVRVERVQEISHEDAIAEGVEDTDPGVDTIGPPYSYARTRFALLWDSINGNRPGCSWDDSPWVWVIEFERVQP